LTNNYLAVMDGSSCCMPHKEAIKASEGNTVLCSPQDYMDLQFENTQIADVKSVAIDD